ncbi:MAG: hypothetical protein KIT31_23300 [Deltaproteobacteria bacterium]|nr:hypothetical protein [Deltaproteobacteria bacterium]
MVRAGLVVAAGVIVGACGPAPHRAPPAPCFEPGLQPAAYAPEGAPDVFDGIALDLPQRRVPRQAPLAFVRTGDRASAPAIGAARLAIDRRDCRGATRALAGLPASHPDRDYVAYLEAWCQHVSGDREVARTSLAQLAASTGDDQLRPFLADDLLEVLVQGDVTSALDALDRTRGRLSADRVAVAMYTAGKSREGGLVVKLAPGAEPEATELACRVKLGDCRRAIATRKSWGMVWRTCTDELPAIPDSACGAADPLAELAALYAWRGEPMGPGDRAAFRAAVERWVAPHPQHHPRFDAAGRDRLALAMLALDWDTGARTREAWRTTGDLAARIHDRTTDPAISRAARTVSDAAHRNAVLLDQHAQCRAANAPRRR